MRPKLAAFFSSKFEKKENFQEGEHDFPIIPKQAQCISSTAVLPSDQKAIPIVVRRLINLLHTRWQSQTIEEKEGAEIRR